MVGNDYGREQPPLRGLIDEVQKRDRLLDLYLGAEDPALIEELERELRMVQRTIDKMRDG